MLLNVFSGTNSDRGDGSILHKAVLSQQHSKMLVIDLARVERIDAGGLGGVVGPAGVGSFQRNHL